MTNKEKDKKIKELETEIELLKTKNDNYIDRIETLTRFCAIVYCNLLTLEVFDEKRELYINFDKHLKDVANIE